MDQLQRLHNEFDFANAAGAELDVALEIFVTNDVALDASFDNRDFIQQIRCRTFRINERLMMSQEFVNKLVASANAARFESVRVVPRFRQTRRNNFPCSRVSEREARRCPPAAAADRFGRASLSGSLRKMSRLSCAQPIEPFVITLVRRDLAFFTVEKNHIDIGTVIQLAAAQFSQSENRKLRIR